MSACIILSLAMAMLGCTLGILGILVMGAINMGKKEDRFRKRRDMEWRSQGDRRDD